MRRHVLSKTVELYWWPRWSTCRKARELLLQHGLEVTERNFFEDNLSETEIWELASMIGIENIFARRSPSLKTMGLADKNLSSEEMVNLMLQEPKLVRRPLFKVGNELMVGGSNASIEAAIAAAS